MYKKKTSFLVRGVFSFFIMVTLSINLVSSHEYSREHLAVFTATDVGSVYYLRGEPHEIHDFGSLLKTEATENETVKCHSYLLFPFSEIGTYSGYYNITAIYYHYWLRVTTPPGDPIPLSLHRIGYNITRAHEADMEEFIQIDTNNNVSYVGDYALVCIQLETNPAIASFEGEEIYNFTIRDDTYPYAGYPEIFMNPYQTSFIFLFVQGDGQPTVRNDNGDMDNDGLTDQDELFIYYTNPCDRDTDNDGATDYEEATGASHGYWNSDPNDYTNTTDYDSFLANAGGPYEGVSGQQIQFKGSVIGGTPQYTWLWDFGDGTISHEQNTTHRYNDSGVYTVTLTVTDKFQDVAINRTTATVKDVIPPTVVITKPENALYINNNKKLSLNRPVLIGYIDIEVNATDAESGISQVDFFLDNKLQAICFEEPYQWIWDERTFFIHSVKVVAYDKAGNSAAKEMKVWKFF